MHTIFFESDEDGNASFLDLCGLVLRSLENPSKRVLEMNIGGLFVFPKPRCHYYVYRNSNLLYIRALVCFNFFNSAVIVQQNNYSNINNLVCLKN